MWAGGRERPQRCQLCGPITSTDPHEQHEKSKSGDNSGDNSGDKSKSGTAGGSNLAPPLAKQWRVDGMSPMLRTMPAPFAIRSLALLGR